MLAQATSASPRLLDTERFVTGSSIVE